MTTAADAPVGEARHDVVWVAVVGVFAGFLAGLFGVGGGVLIVPGLVFAAGMSQRLAHGTSLAATVPISVASLLAYVSQDNVDWSAALWVAIGAVGGAVIGTKLLHVLPQRTLGLLFAAVLIVSAIRLFVDVDASGRGSLSIADAIVLMAIGLISGITAGLLGVGGGIVMVPAMIILFGITPAVAKGTSAAVIIPTAVMGTWRNRTRHNVDLRAALVMGFAGVLPAVLGGLLADGMSPDLSNVLFATLLTVVAARLLWQLARERPPAAP